MRIHRGYRYELDPNNRQRTLLAKHAGCARFAYNWGLEQRIRLFYQQRGRFTNAIQQYRELSQLKKTQFTWMREVSKCAPQEALRDLDKAFENFWRGRKKRFKVGFPKFKRKGRHEGFRLYGVIRVFEKAVQLPRLGRLRLKEKPQIQGRIISATVSRKADRWFVSICVERKITVPRPINGPRIGVDLGIRSLATLSDGTKIKNPQAFTKKLRKLKRLSQQVSRKKKGSHNQRKAIIRLARLYWRISNIRMDVIHKLTTYLAKNHSQIVIEDLCVKGLMKNKRLSRAIADVGFYEFRRQLEYKTRWYGSEVIIISQFFPSSKRCSQCGHTKNEFSLSERVFKCDNCGLQLDRDKNAANNLVAASWAETINACIETGGSRSTLDQCLSMTQEPNTTKT
ncbi:MAG: RNA-guided endonuclease InsQ/TnpB family protein [Candidatus Hermodarchaeota archaeon]